LGVPVVSTLSPVSLSESLTLGRTMPVVGPVLIGCLLVQTVEFSPRSVHRHCRCGAPLSFTCPPIKYSVPSSWKVPECLVFFSRPSSSQSVFQVTGSGAWIPRVVGTQVRVTNLAARGLRAADRGGTSDPYAVVVCGGASTRWDHRTVGCASHCP
jgi:hypothetical protein